MTSDESPNLPVVPQIHSLGLPVAEFEGEMVRLMIGKIPAIALEMEYGYARGTHLKLELEVRVRSVRVDEMTSGKNRGDLYREHTFAIEEAKILGAYSAEQVDQGVGGGLAATGSDVEDETDDSPEGEADGEHTGPDPGDAEGAGEGGDAGAGDAGEDGASEDGEFDPGF